MQARSPRPGGGSRRRRGPSVAETRAGSSVRSIGVSMAPTTVPVPTPRQPIGTPGHGAPTGASVGLQAERRCAGMGTSGRWSSGRATLGGRPRRRFEARMWPFRNSWPPHTPHGSRRAMAPSRHSASTGHSAHRRLAAAMSWSSSEKNRAVRPAPPVAEAWAHQERSSISSSYRVPVRPASGSPSRVLSVFSRVVGGGVGGAGGGVGGPWFCWVFPNEDPKRQKAAGKPMASSSFEVAVPARSLRRPTGALMDGFTRSWHRGITST